MASDYQAYVDSRLISPPIVTVPATNQNPRLRFWHWYSIGGGDHATVEIVRRVQILGRPFLQLWRRGQCQCCSQRRGTVDEAFPGFKPVCWAVRENRLSFYIGWRQRRAPNAGWFVDDVTLVTGTPVFNNPEGFESGLGDWAVDKGTWEVGSPAAGPRPTLWAATPSMAPTAQAS